MQRGRKQGFASLFQGNLSIATVRPFRRQPVERSTVEQPILTVLVSKISIPYAVCAADKPGNTD